MNTNKKNEMVKGAKSSKHIMGQAVDIVINDIDRDGKYTEKDKNIVLDIAERIVIGKGFLLEISGTYGRVIIFTSSYTSLIKLCH